MVEDQERKFYQEIIVRLLTLEERHAEWAEEWRRTQQMMMIKGMSTAAGKELTV